MTLTPSKTKKPFPSSISTVNLDPDELKTVQEWRIALRRVKILYLKSQWKQCATRCNDLLEQTTISFHPLNVTYLNFYAAISNEAIARLMHNLSASKLVLLGEAKKSYQAASDALPAVEEPIADDSHSDRSSTSSSSSSANSTPTPSRPGSPHYPSSPSSTDSINETFHAEPAPLPSEPSTPRKKTPQDHVFEFSPYSAISSTEVTPTQKHALRPSPLRIVKPSIIAPPTFIAEEEPSTPLAQILPTDLSTMPTRAYSVTFSESSSIWLRNRALERYVLHCTSFAEMLTKHVAGVESMMEVVRQAQATGRRVVSRVRDEEGTEEVDLRARIQRLRMTGWDRTRFDPERYQKLCKNALSEL